LRHAVIAADSLSIDDGDSDGDHEVATQELVDDSLYHEHDDFLNLDANED
jgi:hypothetical protein